MNINTTILAVEFVLLAALFSSVGNSQSTFPTTPSLPFSQLQQVDNQGHVLVNCRREGNSSTNIACYNSSNVRLYTWKIVK